MQVKTGMKTQRKRKIWLGVGVFMLAGGDTTSAPAFVASAPAMQSFARRS
jgi:hypothetical protein